MAFQSVESWQHSTNSDAIFLHLGCGSKYWEGWCNIDAYPSDDNDTHRGKEIKPDVWADISRIPVSVSTVSVISSQHVFEHFYKHKTIELISYFYDLLLPGGLLITEMPDLERVSLLFTLGLRPRYADHVKFSRKDIVSSQFYGAAWESNDNPYPYHKYVWQRREFCHCLVQAGFEIVLETGATASHVPFRDMAVIARKPYKLKPTNSNLQAIEHKFLSEYGNPIKRFFRQIKGLFRIMSMCI
jgi:hypothetical protein